MAESCCAPGGRGCGWPEAIVFDFDGTLIDSAPDIAAALNLVLEMKGHQPLAVDEVRFMIGAGVQKLIERGFRARGVELDADHLDDELVDAFLAYYNAHGADLTKLYPGAYALLENLSKTSVKVGLCTNKPTEATREILASFQVEDYFDSIVGGTSGFPKKPDPAGMWACLEEMGVKPWRALYVGDSMTDVKLARNAGLPVVIMSYGYERTSPRELGADLVIDHFDELSAAIEALKAAG
jgi:phosphoglycolate phosphatase